MQDFRENRGESKQRFLTRNFEVKQIEVGKNGCRKKKQMKRSRRFRGARHRYFGVFPAEISDFSSLRMRLLRHFTVESRPPAHTKMMSAGGTILSGIFSLKVMCEGGVEDVFGRWVLFLVCLSVLAIHSSHVYLLTFCSIVALSFYAAPLSSGSLL